MLATLPAAGRGEWVRGTDVHSPVGNRCHSARAARRCHSARAGRARRGRVRVLVLVVSGFMAELALGQSAVPAVFVAHNGNLEGSVAALQVNADGTLTLVNRIVTGSRPNMTVSCPGCNAYSLSLSPSGRYVATGHATGPDPTEQVNVFSVAADAALTKIGTFMVPGTPMDVCWVTDEYLAVTRTDPSPDLVVIYRFLPGPPATLTEVDTEPTGGSNYYLVKHPTLPVVYASDSTYDAIRALRVETNGTLTLVDNQATNPSAYALEMALTPDGKRMYVAGGITEVLQGFDVDESGALAPLPGSPFSVDGYSPSHVKVGRAGEYLVWSDAWTAAARTASFDGAGAPVSTGYGFSVGIQGALGGLQTLGDLLFITDTSDGATGVYSLTVNANGSFTQHGPMVSTGGITPRALAAWAPPPVVCRGDANCDESITWRDIDYFVAAMNDNESAWQALFGGAPACLFANCDVDGDGHVNWRDIDPFVAVMNTVCP